MTNWYQSRYETAMEESVRKAEATLQQFRCMAMANQESSTNWGANLANLRANSANFVATGANLGVSMVNFGYPPPNSPLSSAKFPPLMSNHYGGPPPTSANLEGHQTNDMNADSFLRTQTEYFYQDPRDETFSMGSDSRSAMADRKLPSSNFQFETPMTGISNFGRALSSDFGASMTDFGAYATDLGVSPGNFESPPLMQPRSSNLPPTMSTNNSCASSAATMAEKELFPSAWRRQSEESDRRFYRKLNDFRIEFGMPPVMDSCDPIMNQVYDRTIFVKIHKEFYSVSSEILYTVFSRYGILDRVERLSNGFHSTICFQNKESALWAFECLNGMNLCDDCYRLELFLAKQPKVFSKSSDSTSKNESVGFGEVVNPDITSSGESNEAIEVETLIEVPLDSFTEAAQQVIVDSEANSVETKESVTKVIEDNEEPCFDGEFPNSSMILTPVVFEVLVPANNVSAQVENGNLVEKIGSAEVELKVDDNRITKNSIEMNAFKVFEEMPNKKLVLFGLSVCIKDKAMLGVSVETEIAEAMLVARPNKGVQLRFALAEEWVSAISEKQGVVIHAYGCIHPIVFDPGGIHCLDGEVGEGRVINLDNSSDQLGCSSVMEAVLCDLMYMKSGKITFPLDMDVLNVQLGLVEDSCVVDGSVDTYRILGVIVIFDSGGVLVFVGVGMSLPLSITNGFCLEKRWQWDPDEEVSCWIVTFESGGVLIFIFDPGSVLILILIVVADRFQWDPGVVCFEVPKVCLLALII